MSYIFAVKIVGLKKHKKKRQYAGSLSSAMTAKGSLPSAADGKEATWQATVLPGRLTYLVSLPTVADGKEEKNFAYSGGRQRPSDVCRQRPTAKACR